MPGPGHYESVIYGVGTDSRKYNMQGKTYNPSGKSIRFNTFKQISFIKLQ